MRLSIIVAVARNGVIGINNQLPWRLPEDLQYFKKMTTGKTVVMGRKTYESIGRPLPNRRNIVISRQNIQFDGAEVVSSLEQAVAIASRDPQGEEIMVMGGSQIYSQAIELADRIYLTEVDLAPEGDAFFHLPVEGWVERSRESGVSAHETALGYQFVVFDRVATQQGAGL